jgi:hypothetical protein
MHLSFLSDIVPGFAGAKITAAEGFRRSICGATLLVMAVVPNANGQASNNIVRVAYTDLIQMPANITEQFQLYTHLAELTLSCNGSGGGYGGGLSDAGYDDPSQYATLRANANSYGTKIIAAFDQADLSACVNSSNLSSFVQAIANFVNGKLPAFNKANVQWDGVYFDWEDNINAARYEALISQLRPLIPGKIIGVTNYGDGEGSVGPAPVIQNQINNIDQVFEMCYDGQGSGMTDNNGRQWSTYHTGVDTQGLASGAPASCSGQINGIHNNKGIPYNKIIYGFPLYGYEYPCAKAYTYGCLNSGNQIHYTDIIGTRSTGSWSKKNDSISESDWTTNGSSYITYMDTTGLDQAVAWGTSAGILGYGDYNITMEFNPAWSEPMPVSRELYNQTKSH